jgi:beta-N-acetylhexosaminidase
MAPASRAAVIGFAGHTLSAGETALLRQFPPAGAILFGRNIADPEQLKNLVAALRAALPDGAVLMVDQEGGRVARLRPPHWIGHPPAAAIGVLYARNPACGRHGCTGR